MKKIVFFVMMFSLLMFVGCSKTEIIQQDIVKMVVTGSDVGSCARETLLKKDILIIDTLVQNCTEKSKQGVFLIDGGGGVFPSYIISSGQIMTIDYYPDPTLTTGVICSIDGANYYLTKPEEISGYAAIKNVIGKGLINGIAGEEYPDNIFCKPDDTECLRMIDYGGRTDGKNYFVAGFRDGKDEERSPIFYVINDKLYQPGESDYSIGRIMPQSKRNFVTIKNDKIIVQRIKDGIIVGDEENVDDLDIDKLGSIFTLETCEIDL